MRWLTVSGGGRGRARRAAAWMVAAAAAGALAGCSADGILNGGDLPPDVTDPANTKTPAGALAAYHGAVAQFGGAFGGRYDMSAGTNQSSFVAVSGLFVDELQRTARADATVGVDRRSLPEVLPPEMGTIEINGVYSRLQRTRGQVNQAKGLVRDHGSASQQPLLGHLYAIEGYAAVFLGELFCSGVPLSTLDYEGDYTLKPGSSTLEVLEHALALFDSAIALSGDSLDFAHLARVGRARALLDLDRLSAAAAAAREVPDDFVHLAGFSDEGESRWASFAEIETLQQWEFTVPDREGSNGMAWASSGDPRTPVTQRGTDDLGRPISHPDKYAADGSSPIVLASGLEARLIEAESDLAEGGSAWLDLLNALRTDGTFTTTPAPTPEDPAAEDTTWNAGMGGVAGLAPLEDPGAPESRVDLLFRERAYWLFLTGHRHADLRRLVRRYGRPQQLVFPAGSFGGGGLYGTDVVAPIPPSERALNPLFEGCISRAP